MWNPVNFAKILLALTCLFSQTFSAQLPYPETHPRPRRSDYGQPPTSDPDSPTPEVSADPTVVEAPDAPPQAPNVDLPEAEGPNTPEAVDDRPPCPTGVQCACGVLTCLCPVFGPGGRTAAYCAANGIYPLSSFAPVCGSHYLAAILCYLGGGFVCNLCYAYGDLRAQNNELTREAQQQGDPALRAATSRARRDLRLTHERFEQLRMDHERLTNMMSDPECRERLLKNPAELMRAINHGPPDDYICPITQELMTDPVIISDGTVYERTAIEHWLRQNQKSPLTNLPLETTAIRPHPQLKRAIEEWRNSHHDPVHAPAPSDAHTPAAPLPPATTAQRLDRSSRPFPGGPYYDPYSEE